MMFDKAKIEKAQKIKIFSMYLVSMIIQINDQMYTHSYKNKKADQFLDFIKRIESKYDSSVKQIFPVLDNASIHRSKKVRQTIQKYYHRINSIFTN